MSGERRWGVVLCLGVKNENDKDYRGKTESISLFFIVLFMVSLCLGVKNENDKDYGYITESINAFFMVLLPSLGQVFAESGSSFCESRVKFYRVWVKFCQFLPLCRLSEALGGLFWGFWEIGTQSLFGNGASRNGGSLSH